MGDDDTRLPHLGNLGECPGHLVPLLHTPFPAFLLIVQSGRTLPFPSYHILQAFRQGKVKTLFKSARRTNKASLHRCACSYFHNCLFGLGCLTWGVAIRLHPLIIFIHFLTCRICAFRFLCLPLQWDRIPSRTQLFDEHPKMINVN